MEIDDRWQSAYGDLEFDSAKFPDAPGMVRQLHAMGFKVTVWVMPFVEENSAAYRWLLALHTSQRLHTSEEVLMLATTACLSADRQCACKSTSLCRFSVALGKRL